MKQKISYFTFLLIPPFQSPLPPAASPFQAAKPGSEVVKTETTETRFRWHLAGCHEMVPSPSSPVQRLFRAGSVCQSTPNRGAAGGDPTYLSV